MAARCVPATCVLVAGGQVSVATLVAVGYRHRREDILAGAVEAVLDEGISQLTFGRLATRLDINDRTIVSYFPTRTRWSPRCGCVTDGAFA